MTADKDVPNVEQRASPRHRVLKRGVIVVNSGRSTLNFIMRNLSDGGAKLQLDSLLGVPDNFDLVTADMPRQSCRVAWRGGGALGVEFLSAA